LFDLKGEAHLSRLVSEVPLWFIIIGCDMIKLEFLESKKKACFWETSLGLCVLSACVMVRVRVHIKSVHVCVY